MEQPAPKSQKRPPAARLCIQLFVLWCRFPSSSCQQSEINAHTQAVNSLSTL